MSANNIVTMLLDACTNDVSAPPMITNKKLRDAAECIESLQAQLLESRCRERAAVQMIVGLGQNGASRTLMALELISAERKRQDSIWGEQNHEPQYWVGILGEEFGEYCEAVNETVFDNGPEAREKGGYDNMMKELVHVAAVAVSAIEALMRTKDEVWDDV